MGAKGSLAQYGGFWPGQGRVSRVGTVRSVRQEAVRQPPVPSQPPRSTRRAQVNLKLTENSQAQLFE
jgi:hypothetical protein